ncbi:MAG: sulfite exporter TauE/SafE family protein [Gammaproteobacteria bacterium]|nr:sulfite exporter TauE/SafE family protein [Gammaproteobacteria bacterium]
MPEIALILFGSIIATAAMAIGIGGGILWTPLLILVYQLTPAEAISTSLFIQVAGLGSGTLAYFRAGLVKIKLSAIFSLVALPGIIIGSFITINLSQQTVQMALGIMAMTLAILFVTSNKETGLESNDGISSDQIRSVTSIPFIFGFIMGFLSLGISEWLIPALRTKLKMAMPQAIGTSIAMMFMLAVVAALVHFSLSETVHVEIITLGAIGTLVGGQIGPRISQRINDRLLQQSFIYLMTLIGIHLIFQAI